MTLSPYHLEYVNIAAAWAIPWSIMEAQAFVESTWDPNAVGTHGERGLAQIMLSTWNQIWRYDVLPHPFDDAFIPSENIDAQAQYLNWLRGLVWQKYPGRWDAILWAYNWGIGYVLSKPESAVPSHVRAYAANVLAHAVSLEVEELEARLRREWMR